MTLLWTESRHKIFIFGFSLFWANSFRQFFPDWRRRPYKNVTWRSKLFLFSFQNLQNFAGSAKLYTFISQWCLLISENFFSFVNYFQIRVETFLEEGISKFLFTKNRFWASGIRQTALTPSFGSISLSLFCFLMRNGTE